jgi:hypothetical protein
VRLIVTHELDLASGRRPDAEARAVLLHDGTEAREVS